MSHARTNQQDQSSSSSVNPEEILLPLHNDVLRHTLFGYLGLREKAQVAKHAQFASLDEYQHAVQEEKLVNLLADIYSLLPQLYAMKVPKFYDDDPESYSRSYKVHPTRFRFLSVNISYAVRYVANANEDVEACAQAIILDMDALSEFLHARFFDKYINSMKESEAYMIRNGYFLGQRAEWNQSLKDALDEHNKICPPIRVMLDALKAKVLTYFEQLFLVKTGSVLPENVILKLFDDKKRSDEVPSLETLCQPQILTLLATLHAEIAKQFVGICKEELPESKIECSAGARSFK
jgi:hypothetical protein